MFMSLFTFNVPSVPELVTNDSIYLHMHDFKQLVVVTVALKLNDRVCCVEISGTDLQMVIAEGCNPERFYKEWLIRLHNKSEQTFALAGQWFINVLPTFLGIFNNYYLHGCLIKLFPGEWLHRLTNELSHQVLLSSLPSFHSYIIMTPVNHL